MKVYALRYMFYDDYAEFGIFTSKQKAEKAKDEILTSPHWAKRSEEIFIEEFVLDEFNPNGY